MKKCPFCAEDIQDAAIVCKHCKRELSTPKATTIQCPFCRVLVPKNSKVCPACLDDISGVTGVAARETATESDKGTLGEPVGHAKGLALLAVAIGFLMTLSSTTAGVGIFVLWFGIAFGMTGSAIARWGGGFILALILGAIGISIGGSVAPSTSTPGATSSTPPTVPTSTPASAPSPSEPTYQLALISSKGYESEYGGYHIIEGQVKNVSGQSLKNVTAVGIWLDKDSDFIKSDSAIIEYNPILPGQTSPFKTMSTGNPAMAKFRVEFKTLMGGTLAVDDQRKKKK